MAYQISVTKVSVTQPSKSTGFNITLNLKLWKDGEDTEAVEPFHDKNYNEYLKTNIEGQTEAQLFSRTQLALGKQMQADINRLKLEEAAFAKEALNTMVSNIQGGLTG